MPDSENLVPVIIDLVLAEAEVFGQQFLADIFYGDFYYRSAPEGDKQQAVTLDDRVGHAGFTEQMVAQALVVSINELVDNTFKHDVKNFFYRV